MGEAAVNLAFLGVTSYLVGRDVVSYLPSLPKTSSKRFRGGEPSATTSMDDEVCDPSTLPPRPSASHLPRPVARAVKDCCESLLEQKWSDSAVSAVVPAYTSGRVTCLNDLGQGAAPNERIGNRILMKNLDLAGYLFLPQTAACDIYRFVVVIDTECFGNICTWGQYVSGHTNFLYQMPSASTVGRGKRFTVLADKTVAINNYTTTGTNGCDKIIPFQLRIPLFGSAHYNASAGTISDIVKNSLCLIEVSQLGLCVSNWTARLTFLDG